MNKLQLHMGSLQDMGKRFAEAWRRMSKTHVTFLDAASMQAMLLKAASVNRG